MIFQDLDVAYSPIEWLKYGKIVVLKIMQIVVVCFVARFVYSCLLNMMT